MVSFCFKKAKLKLLSLLGSSVCWNDAWGVAAVYFEKHYNLFQWKYDFFLMKKATVTELHRNFRQISSWIEHGQTVMITPRGHVCAHLSPPPAPVKPFKMPDFRAQAKKIWGDRPQLTEEQVREMKEFELEGQEG